MATETDLEQNNAASETDHGSSDREHDSGRAEGLRADLERAWAEHTGSPPAKDGERSDDELRKAERPGRAARAAKAAAREEAGTKKEQLERNFKSAAAERDATATPAGDKAGAPAAWAREAKAAWQALPKEVQQAVLKRESDVEKGVNELRARYTDLDNALAPHVQTIRQFNHTPAQAVNQLFGWFQHIAADPRRGLTDLARSFGVNDINFGGGAQPQQPRLTPEQRQIQEYFNSIETRLGNYQNHIDEQQQATVNNVIANFAKDRPHFEKVRVTMGKIIQQGIIPLTPEGHVDLATAYDTAVRMDPTLHDSIVNERLASERQAQSANAKRARSAGASLSPTSPGSASKEPPAKRGRSVRESLMDAIADQRR
jgi:hypothetical protein